MAEVTVATRNPAGDQRALDLSELGSVRALVTGLRDNLCQAGDAQVVVVSSGAQRLAPFGFDDPQFERRTYDPWVAYAQSKTAGALLAVGLARLHPHQPAAARRSGHHAGDGRREAPPDSGLLQESGAGRRHLGAARRVPRCWTA
ncbi:hypothetical protein [Nonomuraea zeae]|uniref:hypothetical protein n=1 Tax=Nonomuraea zeae TaxID=1642303 RepID=UPI00197E474A|nr:hypothetical protein [Nonomuraea zeae]